VRVTDEAVAAAVEEAGWEWQAGPDENGAIIPSPAECMRPILEAATSHLVDDRIAAVLALHRRNPRDPGYCMHDREESWPCRTARAVGVEP
jgi:hypothetical protein